MLLEAFGEKREEVDYAPLSPAGRGLSRRAIRTMSLSKWNVKVTCIIKPARPDSITDNDKIETFTLEYE